MCFSVSAQMDRDKFSKLTGSEPSVEINLGSTMLGLLSSAMKNEEQGIANILSSLTAINVTVYELDEMKQLKSLKKEINQMADEKISLGFEKLATIRDDDSLVYIFANMDEKNFNNLSIYALDDEDELVLIDIKGKILISQIGELMEHFNVDLDINGLDLGKDK
jgi:hypothetical protein